MKAATLSQLLAAIRAKAERENIPAVTAIYESKIMDLAGEASRTFSAMTASAWQTPPDGTILTLAVLQKITESANGDLDPIWRRVLLQVAGTPLARARISWDVAHPLAEGLLEAAAQRTGQQLGAAIQPVLRKAVGDAYEAGLSVTDTAAQISAALTDAAPWQAEMLARTDLNSLANGASHATARLVGVGFKTWDATLDDRTRETHAEAHGQTVPLDATFDVGGESLDYPGDPAGSDAETINCRCAILYADTLAEGEGLLASGGSTIPRMAGIRKRSKRRAVVNASKNLRGALGVQAPPLEPGVAWSGVLTLENAATSDGRWFAPGSWTWRDLPMDLLAQFATAEGHDGAVQVGRIDRIWKEPRTDLGAGIVAVMAEGVFIGTDDGTAAAEMVAEDVLRRISVDYNVTEAALRDPETGELIDFAEADIEQTERFFAGELQLAALASEIGAATLVSFSAFSDAAIALVASASGHGLVVNVPVDLQRALTAAAAPSKPPRAWFETQEPPGKMPLTITEEGRVFGHLADWTSCHIAFLPSCIPPPKSASNYAYFHAGEIETAEGERVAVGKLMVGGRHDNNLSHSREEAMRHYDDLSRVGAVLRATDGKYGIWVAGALHSSVTDAQIADMKLNPPSGDWRVVNGQHELICGLSVPVPGFPIPRAEMQIVASGGMVEMGALVAALGPEEAEHDALMGLVASGALTDAQARALDQEDAERRIAVLAAQAEGVDALLALAEA